jgi:hypothetical protein
MFPFRAIQSDIPIFSSPFLKINIINIASILIDACGENPATFLIEIKYFYSDYKCPPPILYTTFKVRVCIHTGSWSVEETICTASTVSGAGH